jgi:hypothetical protein
MLASATCFLFDRSMHSSSLGLLVILGMTGCRTLPPLAAVNIQEPGWTVRQGQAVWQKAQKASEIAGELLIATHPDGRSVIQFMKPPFPLVVAQSSADSWQIQYVAQKRRLSGKGSPPKQMIWFQLARCFAGKYPPAYWSFEKLHEKAWRLENPRSGEALEAHIN